MSRVPSTLRQRLIWALATFSAATALLVGLAIWSSDVLLEDAAVRDLMERELALVAGVSSGEDEFVRHHTLRFYRSQTVPDAIRDLPDGFNTHVFIGDRQYHVLVKTPSAEERLYLAYDVSFIERRELALGLAAVVILLLVTTAGVFTAQWIATQALHPLDDLVRQLERLDPERRGEQLRLPSAHSEFTVFVRSMNRYMAELDAMVERERAFAAAASHELRTPLAVIQGAAETLALTDTRPQIARIARAVNEARHQLEALLALSRVNETPALEQMDMPGDLRILAETYLHDAPTQTQLIWDAPEAFRIELPTGAIAVIFTNLLRNALRAAKGGPVTVRVDATAVEVLDEGPGIDPGELPHVFEPRFRGRDGGSGMGLYIARVLAQRLGWELTLENRTPGSGVRARLQFRRATPGGGARRG